jgi:hypothetical protein
MLCMHVFAAIRQKGAPRQHAAATDPRTQQITPNTQILCCTYDPRTPPDREHNHCCAVTTSHSFLAFCFAYRTAHHASRRQTNRSRRQHATSLHATQSLPMHITNRVAYCFRPSTSYYTLLYKRSKCVCYVLKNSHATSPKCCRQLKGTQPFRQEANNSIGWSRLCSCSHVQDLPHTTTVCDSPAHAATVCIYCRRDDTMCRQTANHTMHQIQKGGFVFAGIINCPDAKQPSSSYQTHSVC